MLFDLKGKRRRTVQATYLTLAVLMGAGLVFFGIGSSVSGGARDPLRGGGGGRSADQSGNFTSGARGELEQTTQAWERYSAAVAKPDKGLASTAIQSYSGLAEL